MKRAMLAAAALLAAFAPASATAQTVWLGGRAGTLGLGFDVSIAANDWFVIRGGTGGYDTRIDVTSVSRLAENRTAWLQLPRTMYTIGADIEVGNFRIGGGMLYKDQDPHYAVALGDGATIDIGGGGYRQPDVTRLSTTVRSNPWAPYALLGLGQHNGGGLGFFLDAGVAFLEDPELTMSAEGDPSVLRSRSFDADLRAEQGSVRDDLGDLIKFWPILNFGIRYGIGGGDRRRSERQ